MNHLCRYWDMNYYRRRQMRQEGGMNFVESVIRKGWSYVYVFIMVELLPGVVNNALNLVGFLICIWWWGSQSGSWRREMEAGKFVENFYITIFCLSWTLDIMLRIKIDSLHFYANGFNIIRQCSLFTSRGYDKPSTNQAVKCPVQKALVHNNMYLWDIYLRNRLLEPICFWWQLCLCYLIFLLLCFADPLIKR